MVGRYFKSFSVVASELTQYLYPAKDNSLKCRFIRTLGKRMKVHIRP
jgi:hypothetical protein